MIPFLAPLLLKLRALPWKWIGAVAVMLLAWWQIRAYADRVADRREAEVRALWAEDTAARDKVAADQKTAAQANQAGAVTIGNEVDHELEAKYDAALAERDNTLRLLQRARSEVRACSSNRASDSLVAAETSEARRLAELRQLDERFAAVAADLRAEAGMNADQLDGLLRLLRAQTVCPVSR